jgi:surface antigen
MRNYFFASDWAQIAKIAGLKTGTTPIQGSIVVYQPFVQGASVTGHVARVTSVQADGHFTVDEMNYPVLGLLDSRDSWVEPGVSFIYQ